MEPTPDQIRIARNVAHKLSKNLPRSGVLGPEDVAMMAIEALLVLISTDKLPADPSHLGAILRSRTIDAMRLEGSVKRVSDGEGGRRLHEPEKATLDSLQPYQREILGAIFEEDISPAQFAERTGRSVAWVYVAKALALRALRGELTKREVDVLLLSADGLSSREAAAELGIGDETVKSHRNRAIKALGARNTTHAVAIAFRRGLLV